MVGKLVIRGLIIGIVAGLLCFGYARSFGEPSVGVAIKLEETHAEAEKAEMIRMGHTPEAEEPEMFGRDIQTGAGLATGIVAIGAGIGAISGLLFAFAYGRMGSLGAKSTAGMVGLMGLVTFYVVPFLKYPANPPTVGAEETIKLRTGLYFLMIALSIISTLAGLFIRSKLKPKYGAWNASVVGAAAYVVILTVVFVVLPSFNEAPADFPAVTMWNFRVAAIGMQTILWGATAILLGYFNGLGQSAAAPTGRTAAA